MSNHDLPSKKELQEAWLKVKDIHREYLARHNVNLPDAKNYWETSKSMWLAVLLHYEGQEVDKNFMMKVAERDRPNHAGDQQVRHLKRDGWEIGDIKGKHKLDPYKPSMEFLNVDRRKSKTLSASTFGEIKEAYGFKCATCGGKEGQPDSRYGSEKIKLQKAHMNPLDRGDIKGNIIPQCQFCNRAYRGDYVFDDKGRVKSVADVRPVQKADKKVQRMILKWLEKHMS
ncbi:MAG: hypothetical protein ACR2PR_02630 [Pseudohongiellaceae bacterium]